MADEKLSTSTPLPSSAPPPAPAGPDRPMAPLTPVFLVWPGRRDGGSWTLLWFGFALVVAGLLPWQGRGDQTVVTKSGQVITLLDVEYAEAVASAYKQAGRDPLPVPEIASVAPPANRSIGSVLVLLCGIGMVVAGAVNVFHQRLVMFTPVLFSMVIVALVLWFTFSVKVSAEGTSYDVQSVRAFQHLGSLLPSLIGIFGEPGVPTSGSLTDHDVMVREFSVFGLGVYVALLTDLVLFIFLAITIVSALAKAKKDDAGGGGGSGARRRPSAAKR